MVAAEGANRHLQVTAADRWLLAIPDYHIGGLAIFARAHLTSSHVDRAPAKWEGREFVRTVRDCGTTLTSLVPTQIFDLVNQQLECPESLRAVVVGGGNLPESIYLRARDLRWPLLPSYGLTEAASQVATASLDSLNLRELPLLLPLSHVEVELRQGQIFIRSLAVCEQVAGIDGDGTCWSEDPRRNGLLPTEDLAENEHGLLRILGRRDRVVKVLGVLVPLVEVEAAVGVEFERTQPAMIDFTIITLPDDRAGARLVLLTDTAVPLNVLTQAIDRYNSTAPGPKRISLVGWLPHLPRTELQKIKVAELRNLWSSLT